MKAWILVLSGASVALLCLSTIIVGGTPQERALLGPDEDVALSFAPTVAGTTWVRVHPYGLSPCAPEDIAGSAPLQTTEHVWCFEGAGGDDSWPVVPGASYGHYSRYNAPAPLPSRWHVTSLHGGSGTGSFNAWAGCDVSDPSPGCEDVSSWVNPGGYGNDWRDALTLDCSGQNASAGGDVSFDLRYDSECLYDYLYVEYYDDTTLAWRLLEDASGHEAIFNGVSGDINSICGVDYFGFGGGDHGNSQWWPVTFPIPPVSNLKLRWRLLTDGSGSDEDGIFNTDGLGAIDNVYINLAASGDWVSDDFESGDFYGVVASSGPTPYWTVGLYGDTFDGWHLEFDPNYLNKGNTPTFSNDWMWAAKPANSGILAAGFDFFLVSPVIEVQGWEVGILEYSRYYCFLSSRNDFGQEVVRTHDSAIDQWSSWQALAPPLVDGCTEWSMNQQLSLTEFLGSEVDSLQVGWEVWDGSVPGDFMWGKHNAVQFLVDNVSFGFFRPDLVDAPEPVEEPGGELHVRPNPFKDRTEITFSTRATGEIALSIYDVRGSLIRSLASGRRPAGTHSAVWDGRDDAGTLVPSGIYFYRLTADRDTRSGKLVLLRSPE